MLKHPFTLLCLAGLMGWVAHFAMAPYNFPPAFLIAFPGLYMILGFLKSAKTIFLSVWLFFFAYFTFGLYWIGNALLIEGNEQFLWAYPLALAALPALLALFPTFLLGSVAWRVDLRTASGFCLFISALSISEFLRGHLFTGFPWNSFGYSWISLPTIMQSVSLGGLYFLNSLTLFWACLPCLILIRRYKVTASLFLIAGIISLLTAHLWGEHRLQQYPLHANPAYQLHIIQPNISQHLKWNPDYLETHFEKLVSLSRQALDKSPPRSKNILIWPETATTSWLLQRPSFQKKLNPLFEDDRPVYVLSGLLSAERQNGETVYTNSFVILPPDRVARQKYDKHHLVPFGEYIPFQEFIPLDPVVNFSGFQAGTGPQTLAVDKDLSISPLICYEIIFPGRTISHKKRPHILINVTNDAWYGDSAGPRQHLVQSIFRAVETGIPLARAANNGISALIDPLGRKIETLGYNKQGIISASLPRRLQGETAFARNQHLLFVLFNLLFLGLAVTDLIKKRYEKYSDLNK